MLEKLHITSSRLKIRNLQLTDLEKFHAYRSNPAITKYQGFDTLNLEEARTFILKQTAKLFGTPNEFVQYAIVLKETNNLIGDCAIKISSLEKGTASVGVTISANEQKKGYAKEILDAILSFLFDTKDIHRVVEYVSEDNIGSKKILQHFGFRKEGVSIDEHQIDGEWHNLIQFAMLKKEWNNRKDKE